MPHDIILQIQGMTCATCVTRIEKTLLKQNGILSAVVNLATEKAHVTFDDSKINKTELIKILKQTGFESQESKPFLERVDLEKASFDKKIIITATLLTLPLVAPMILMPFDIHFTLNGIMQALLATPVQFLIGGRFYKSAYKAIKNKSANMDLLVAIGTSAAYFLSFYLLIKNKNSHLYFESSSVVITLVLIGKYLETKAKKRTTQAISELQNLSPKTARVIRGQMEEEISLVDLQLHDIVVVKAGEQIPVDGEIIQGSSQINESLITGEAFPVERTVYDRVIGGSVNGDGLLHIKVLALGQETMLSRIITMVEKSQTGKLPIQQLVDKVSAWFVPIVVIVAVLTLLLTGLIHHSWEEAIINAVAVLVMACPCALGLATPTSIMVGTGIAASAGILIKDAETLETAHSLTTIVFDKTGTLTEGSPTVCVLKAIDGDESEFIKILTSLQAGSEHPLARAIMKFAREKGITPELTQRQQSIPGSGLKANLNGINYKLGSKKILTDLGIRSQLGKEEEQRGETLSFLIDEDQTKILGFISFKDEIKKNAKHTINKLHALGIKTVLLTGDNLGSATRVAKELGILKVNAEMLPHQKLEFIQKLKDEGETVGMVGDGINDAPSLALANVSMAMSTGADIAMLSASMTLMNGNPMLVAYAISISNKTYSKIKQNLFWAFVYNIIGIPLAALGYLNPMVAGAAMAMSSISVVLNSLLLKRWKPF